MLVRSPVRFVCALAMIAPLLVCCAGCKWLMKSMLEEEERPRDTSGVDMAQLWEDGYGFDNPNAELIRTGKKKPGETPKKGKNPFYKEVDEEEYRRSKESEGFRVEEPVFDFR
jgi:hypothetical protein